MEDFDALDLDGKQTWFNKKYIIPKFFSRKKCHTSCGGNGGMKLSLVLNKDINQLMDDLNFLAREQLVPLPLLEATLLYARDFQNVADHRTVLQQSYKQSEIYMNTFDAIIQDFKQEINICVVRHQELQQVNSEVKSIEVEIQKLQEELACVKQTEKELQASLCSSLNLAWTLKNHIAQVKPGLADADAFLLRGISSNLGSKTYIKWDVIVLPSPTNHAMPSEKVITCGIA